MATYTCPLCPRTFATKQTLAQHMILTTKHAGAVEHILALTALLAEAERAVAIYREQRDEWRAAAQGRREAA
jgi:hypothetical protein